MNTISSFGQTYFTTAKRKADHLWYIRMKQHIERLPMSYCPSTFNPLDHWRK